MFLKSPIQDITKNKNTQGENVPTGMEKSKQDPKFAAMTSSREVAIPGVRVLSVPKSSKVEKVPNSKFSRARKFRTAKKGLTCVPLLHITSGRGE